MKGVLNMKTSKMTFKYKMTNGTRGQITVETNEGISETMHKVIEELEKGLRCEVDTMTLTKIKK